MLFRKTLEAFADTVVPPDDGPGAVDVGALTLYRDAFYRARPSLPFVALHLNLWALLRHARSFPALKLEQRTRILMRCEQSRLLGMAYEGLIMLTKTAFYGGLLSRAGHDTMGYPGPNEGYPDTEEVVTFESETEDGNYP